MLKHEYRFGLSEIGCRNTTTTPQTADSSSRNHPHQGIAQSFREVRSKVILHKIASRQADSVEILIENLHPDAQKSYPAAWNQYIAAGSLGQKQIIPVNQEWQQGIASGIEAVNSAEMRTDAALFPAGAALPAKATRVDGVLDTCLV